MDSSTYDACVVGSGMAGLTTASLLANEGLKVGVLEQNWIPGGCTSAYWRKGFIFESGATTLVGLEKNMPLGFLLDKINVEIEATELDLPMQVHLKNGETVNRHKSLEAWIIEAENKFGKKNQRAFWEFCFKISEFVWDTSLKQRAFPLEKFSDLLFAAGNASFKQLKYARYSLISMKQLLQKFDLLENSNFVDFCNEQLLITAQNHIEEVNVLFGATALCYTNYPNYYVNGGLINLVNPLVQFIEKNQSKLILRCGVESIEKKNEVYYLHTKKHGIIKSKFLISSIPVNNTLSLTKFSVKKHFSKSAMESAQLNSAFQMGIAFKSDRPFEAIHHQIHLANSLPETGSASIFISLSHDNDSSRSDEPGYKVASVSTHVNDPENRIMHNKALAEKAVIQKLEQLGFLNAADIAYMHSSTPKAWQKWTRRAYGFVGGYPQYMKIKPWQMLGSRLDGDKAYLCGDTTYPGQGIPGATLSGVIAFEKLKRDHL
ncbi:MAG: NAD(P)/FAD-dependent oxidoreductase [Bacteroidota bacterium]